MHNWQSVSDKAAIGLSITCALHCLLVPAALVLMPSVASLALDDESFHIALLIAVIPASVVALTLGCRRHKRYRVIGMGGVGLVVLVVAAVAGHDLFDEWGEKGLTLLGALIVATSHVGNYRLCQSHRCEPTPNRVSQ